MRNMDVARRLRTGLVLGLLLAAGAVQAADGISASILQQTFGNLSLVLRDASPAAVTPTPGTVSVSGSLTWQNQKRPWLLIRPATAVAGAPVLLLLHAHGMNPAGMA